MCGCMAPCTGGTWSAWSPSPSSSHDANGCWSATSSASGQPRQFLFSSVLLWVVPGLPGSVARGQRAQRGPPGVDHVVVVVRVVREARSALGAQSRAVVPAHRLERQCRHHRVPEHGFEVEQVALERVLLGLVVVRSHLTVVGRAIGVGEQLLEGPVDLVG